DARRIPARVSCRIRKRSERSDLRKIWDSVSERARGRQVNHEDKSFSTADELRGTQMRKSFICVPRRSSAVKLFRKPNLTRIDDKTQSSNPFPGDGECRAVASILRTAARFEICGR